jgi:hypothetical protein
MGKYGFDWEIFCLKNEEVGIREVSSLLMPMIVFFLQCPSLGKYITIME